MSLDIEPLDEHNTSLIADVHPQDWVNPEPDGRYNLVVIGAGTADLVAAAGAAGIGAKVALIERNLMGGDCLNTGCVPSKAVIRSGRVAATIKQAGEFGIQSSEPSIDFAKVMERMRKLRSDISPNDSAARFKELGVDVYLGQGTFTSNTTIEVDGKTLTFSKAVIATGARASAPPIPGLDTVPYLTNETLFNLTEQPKRFGVIGAGPIGCEMAQTFARLGSEVTLFEMADTILPREDPEAASIVSSAMNGDGVNLITGVQDMQVSSTADGIQIQRSEKGETKTTTIDTLLVAVGRKPNIEGMGLETVGVETHARGVTVNDRLQTTNPKIYACGDVCSPYQFTHAADFMARTVIQNALFMGRKKASDLLIPWSTYTSPEIAHVGTYEHTAAEEGIELDTFTVPFEDVDRAILDGETEGFVRIHVKKGSDQIIGATIVAEHAGDLISSLTLAMKNKVGLGSIASTIHPYPTQAEAIRRAGDAYNRTRFTPTIAKVFAKWLSWTR